MTLSVTKFDADFLLRRLAEHRERQRREELQSIAQIFDEVGGALEVGERLTVGRGPQRIVNKDNL
jgi:hypothetical protein